MKPFHRWGALLFTFSAAISALAQAGTPRLIDIHIHYNGEPGILAKLLVKLNAVDGMAILLTTPQGLPEAARFIREHPDRFVGFGDVKLDDANVLDEIDRFHQEGFRGLGEITSTLKNYDDRSYWPIYDRADRYHMLLLFHTGIVNRLHPEHPADISFDRSRVTRLDLIARHWPKLTIIGAHLGNPDYAEAAEIGRWDPNLYFDVSGTTLLKKKNDYRFFQSIFWWSGLVSPHTPKNGANAFEKLVFGSDVFNGELDEFDGALSRYHAMLDACEVPQETQEKIFSGTMWSILQQQEREMAADTSATEAPVTGPFSAQELQQFAALNPIDTHTHIYQKAPVLVALLERLNLHVLDIVVARDTDQKSLDEERRQVWGFVNVSHGYATMCTTFDPFLYREPSFRKAAIAEIDNDFDHGAAAVKIWKNIGEQVKDSQGNYLMPDDPVFEPIYKEISDRDKTLIAHLADPDSIWEPPTPKSPDYEYYMQHPEWYMYNKPNAPSKAAILVARDHILEKNPKLRVVGAHLGSMEADFKQLADHLDRYPNFAVDIAARMPYIVMLPRVDAIAFIEKYQDRLIYATDHSLAPEAKAQDEVEQWETSYAFDWRFLATSDPLQYRNHRVEGLALPTAVLHKLYHDNALHWIPGVMTAPR